MQYITAIFKSGEYQYDIDDVKGNLKQKLEKIIGNDNKDENDKSFELIEYIENYEGFLSVASFSKYCATMGVQF